MTLRERAGSILGVLLIGMVLLILIGQVLGQPILLGYVATGSMSPTLEAGDGFVAIPPSIAGDIQEGDVVTFDARELEGGGLTTHRVVEVTDEGYITRGDANPFLDQDGDEPPVTDGQIAAVALQVNGEVVRIPHLGTAVMGLHNVLESIMSAFSFLPGLSQLAAGGMGTIMVGFGILLLAFSFVTDAISNGRERATRSRKRPGVLSAPVMLAIILLLILLPLTASMMIPSGTLELGIVSSQSPSADPTVIGVGESQEINYSVTNEGFIPKVIVLEPASPGISVSESVLIVNRGETAETTVTVTAPDETGFYLRHLSERHYMQLLPTTVVYALHTVHPWLAMGVINVLVGGLVSALFLLSFGMEPLRLRETGRNIPFGKRIRRAIRRWL